MKRSYKQDRLKVPFKDVFQHHGNTDLDIADGRDAITKMVFGCLDKNSPISTQSFNREFPGRLYYGNYNLLPTEDNSSLVETCLRYLVWKHSELTGKFCGCPYWSAKAKALFEGKMCELAKPTLEDAWQLAKELSTRTKKEEPQEVKQQRITHEHVFPINHLVKFLRHSDSQVTAGHVKEMIEQRAIGCVILQSEDSPLKKLDGNCDNPWLRYKGKIKLFDNPKWTAEQRKPINDADLL
jgi:hypothetical protein